MTLQSSTSACSSGFHHAHYVLLRDWDRLYRQLHCLQGAVFGSWFSSAKRPSDSLPATKTNKHREWHDAGGGAWCLLSAVESVRSLPLLYCASATLLTGELTYTGNRDHNRERSAHTRKRLADALRRRWTSGRGDNSQRWTIGGQIFAAIQPGRRGCVRPGFLQQWPRRTTGSHANRLRRLSNW